MAVKVVAQVWGLYKSFGVFYQTFWGFKNTFGSFLHWPSLEVA